MHVMIISDLDVQLIMLLSDDVRLEVYFLTKKKKRKEKVFFLSMLSCLNITMVYYEKYNALS